MLSYSSVPLWYVAGAIWGIPALAVSSLLRLVGIISVPQPRWPPNVHSVESENCRLLAETPDSTKVAIVTGSNTGIGLRTAFNLAKRGYRVVVACRDMIKADRAASQITAELGADCHGSVTPMRLDLADLDTIREFVQQFSATHQRLDLLVNNAGVNSGGTTAQGLELKMGVNYFGHFALTRMLMPQMLGTPGSARVVNLSSVMHHFGDSTQFSEETLRSSTAPTGSYTTSKLLMLLFTMELNRRFRSQGVTAVACNPGAVHSDIWRHSVHGLFGRVFSAAMWLCFLTTEQGCFTTLEASLIRDADLVSMGAAPYCQPYLLPFGRSCLMPFEMVGPFSGASWAPPRLPHNAKAEAERVWRISERMMERHQKSAVAALKRNSYKRKT